ncbi:hypothetical protein ACTXML_09075 [Glutamicibacter arilaitensis]|uniref:hypothetical protein n=1 Tax=Glutamicibacter arilaitensis TaxID=256701 RepID=UPI003FD48BDA
MASVEPAIVGRLAIETYLAVAQPELKAKSKPEPNLELATPAVTGEQINVAGWTCNGIHESGDYSTCEECRDACDDLARFYNHMMQNPRQFKHWTGRPEVNDAKPRSY